MLHRLDDFQRVADTLTVELDERGATRVLRNRPCARVLIATADRDNGLRRVRVVRAIGSYLGPGAVLRRHLVFFSRGDPDPGDIGCYSPLKPGWYQYYACGN